MKNLEYYLKLNTDTSDKSTYLSLIQENISGGKITQDDIDVIRQYPHVTAISISGLRQDTFDYFVERYGNQFNELCKWYSENPHAAPEDYQAS